MANHQILSCGFSSLLTKGQNGEDLLWPMIEEGCPYVGLGTKCDPICVYCDMKHVCMHCALKPRSVEASIDPPCPMRIPGCRCSSDAGPSILEYYCHAGNPFMGACVQDARGEEFIEEEIEDEECLEERTGEDDVIEEERGNDGLLEASRNKSLFNVIGGEEALDDENENEEFVKDDNRKFLSPQSLWPLSPVFWKGPVSRDLPSPSQSQVDYHDYSGLASEPRMIGPQCAVAAGRHACGGRSQSSLDVLQLPTPYNLSSPFSLASREPRDQNPTIASQRSPAEESPYSSTFVHYATPSLGSPPFLLGSSGLDIQEFEAAAEKRIQGKIPSSRKLAREKSGPGHKRAAVGEARSAQQSATKKDSRGWGEHEKALVKILLKEVILEGTHAWTEERWKVISRRLSNRYAIDRTWTAVKK